MSDAQVLVPVEQDSVNFYGQQILAARLPDGRIAAAFAPMCEALQLERSSQRRRIQEDEAIADQLVSVRVETEGGPQSIAMLTAWAIPTWLTGIKLTRVAPEKRPAILAFKREAADALYKHFSHAPAQLTAPTTLVPSEPITEPVAPGPAATASEWIRYHQQMVAFLEWQQDVEAWRDSMESRLESVEEITRLVPELIERLGPQTLSPEHQRTVQSLAKRLHETQHAAYATIYAELGEHFHVSKYDQIPEARWAEVMTWFSTRIR